MPKEPMKRKVTKKEIDNAIFVDFEGAKTGTNTEPDYSGSELQEIRWNDVEDELR